MTPDTKALSELVERVEKAEGPDRELDRAIECAFFGGQPMPRDPDRVFRKDGRGYGYTQAFACHTASLDAALALVERCKPDWAGLIHLSIAGSGQATIEARDPCDRRAAQAFGHTPALALIAALLSSLSPELAGREG